MQAIRNALPDHARDLRTNLDAVLSEAGAAGLNARQIWITALGCAIASRHQPLVIEIESAGAAVLSDGERKAARAAAAIMAMNNIYYRFTHLVSDESYRSMSAKLRMTVIGNPGIEKIDFELVCLAVSAINGCGMCMDSHEKVLRKAGATPDAIQSAVRIAAVIHAVAVTLEQDAHDVRTLATAA